MTREKEKTSNLRQEMEESKSTDRFTKKEFLDQIRIDSLCLFMRDLFDQKLEQYRLDYEKLIGDRS